MSDNVYIGELNHKIKIYEKTKVKSTTGENVETDSLLFMIWAKVEDAASSEQEDGKVMLYAQRNYTVRYHQTIIDRGEQLVIKESDGDYRIYGVARIGKKDYIKIKTIKRE